MSATDMRDRATEDANKQLVLDFYRHVFDAQNADAVKDFVAEDYVQHCRHMPSGRAGLEVFVRQIFPDGPRPVPEQLAIPPAFVVADGDMVVISAYMPQPEPDRPEERYDYFVFDAFRVRAARIVEHWSSVNKIAPPRHG
jgi:predicted SnoaL-like aldol condensation-catalyzing enzyme